jgi:hypothetical protein
MRHRFLSIPFLAISVALSAHAQENPLSEAADELRLLAENRPVETVTLRIDGNNQEISFVTDDDGKAIYQGDIVLGDAKTIHSLADGGALTLQELEAQDVEIFGLVARNAKARWPDGKVPYFVDASVPSAWVTRINDAIAHWETHTRIRFTKLEKPLGDYILFFDNPGADHCQSPIGRSGSGAVRVQLASWCKWGNVAHEIGHALGLHHEQARFDRNRFIKVEFTALATDSTKRNFEPDKTKFEDFGPYCYDSIMHYPKTGVGGAFVLSALEEPLGEWTGDKALIGQRTGLAKCDVDTINKYYGLAAVDESQDTPAGDEPAFVAAGSRFEGDLELYPQDCQAQRRCFLKNALRYSDTYGLVWQAGHRDPNSADTILSGMTDGASIPQFAQPFVGPPFDPSYLKAAVIHDHYMYKENRVRSWWAVQRVFYDMLQNLEIPETKAKIMYLGVVLGASKWIRLVPGQSCGPNCVNDLADALPQVDSVNGNVYREWPETFGTPEFVAAMQRGIAELQARGENMTLGDVNLVAKALLKDHPVFTEGDSYSPGGASDTVIAGSPAARLTNVVSQLTPGLSTATR